MSGVTGDLIGWDRAPLLCQFWPYKEDKSMSPDQGSPKIGTFLCLSSFCVPSSVYFCNLGFVTFLRVCREIPF